MEVIQVEFNHLHVCKNVLWRRLMGIRGPTRFRPVESETPSVIHETRSTPSKFTTPHVKGRILFLLVCYFLSVGRDRTISLYSATGIFNALGQLLVVNPCSPLDGQPADVDIYHVSPPDDDPDCVKFMNFTGPFIV